MSNSAEQTNDGIVSTNSGRESIKHFRIVCKYLLAISSSLISDGPGSVTLNDTGPITTVVGSHVAVLCTADYNPPCDMKWRDDQCVEYTEELLTLPDIQPDQQGRYTSVARNDRSEVERSTELDIIVNCK